MQQPVGSARSHPWRSHGVYLGSGPQSRVRPGPCRKAAGPWSPHSTNSANSAAAITEELLAPGLGHALPSLPSGNGASSSNGTALGNGAAPNGANGNGAAVGAAATSAAHPVSEAEPAGEPYTLVRRAKLAGGELHLVRLEGSRLLRVWLPPGYSRLEAARHPYPLLLLNDGQNLFDDSLSFSGASWRAADTAAQLITSGQLPPFLLVGIDHAGPNRSLEYLPYKPGTGPGGFRKDAADWPGGEVAAYMERVTGEVMPWLADAYGAATDPAHVAFGGSSFGGICALWACMYHAGQFGAVLVESPSLWIADEKFFKEEVQRYEGPWPERMVLGMGSREYSGIRSEPGPQWDALLVEYCEELAAVLRGRGLGTRRLKWQVEEGATHTESAWAQRLPAALAFLLQPWWAAAMARHRNSLYFTSPRKLQAGQPAVLFVQKSKSHALAGHRGKLQVKLGFNNWTAGEAQLEMQLAPQLELDAAAAAAGATGSRGGGEASWQAASFRVPESAYEMQFVLTDSHGTWDNNAGSDFYVRVKLPAAEGEETAESAIVVARAAAEGPVDDIARRSGSKLYFTSPEALVAGAPARLYFNRARSWALAHNPNVKVHLGFNSWEAGGAELQLAPTSLWRGEAIDWWATPTFQVPQQAFEVSFAFTDGHGAWDSNDSHNYSVPVKQLGAATAAAPRREIASVEVVDHAGGKLHIINLARRAVTDKATKEARWTEEKVLRVWTPPGYSKEAAPAGGWPVLYMNDGQNMMEDWLAHQGHAWNVGHCAAGLIASGTVPPFIVVAIDSAGPMRSLNYLPYKPGTGVGGFRGDAERWPGGGCEGYMCRLVQELIPLVADTFGVATDPARVAYGGGSFAGVTALYAALHYPHVFGCVLAESPSLWIAEGRFLGDLWAHRGPLPERIFMGCGTREYSATRDHDRDDVDALLLYYYQEAARALEAAGMRGPQRLAFQVEEGAGHHELAWSWRLTGALTYLLSPWWD